MKVAFWIWTVLCAFLAVLLISVLPVDRNYVDDPDVTLISHEGRQLAIDTEDVVIEAAAGVFFVLRNSSTGETVAGVLTQPPLGWSQAEYYRAGPTEISGGIWVVEKGSNVTIHLSGPRGLTVQESMGPKEEHLLNFFLAAGMLIVWFFGVFLGNSADS